jgi:hypothetical protein
MFAETLVKVDIPRGTHLKAEVKLIHFYRLVFEQ